MDKLKQCILKIYRAWLVIMANHLREHLDSEITKFGYYVMVTCTRAAILGPKRVATGCIFLKIKIFIWENSEKIKWKVVVYMLSRIR